MSIIRMSPPSGVLLCKKVSMHFTTQKSLLSLIPIYYIFLLYLHNYSYSVVVFLLKPKIIVNATVYVLGQAYLVYVELPFE